MTLLSHLSVPCETPCSILQIPHYIDSGFRESAITYITHERSNNRNADMYILVNMNYVWSASEFCQYIGYKEMRIIIEGTCSSMELIGTEIRTTYSTKYGYTVNEYDVVLEHSTVPVRIFNLRRDMIRIVYMTDEDNDIIRNCKDSISEYCTEYKYNFIHYSSGAVVTEKIGSPTSDPTDIKTDVLPSSFRDVKDRIELIHDLFIQDDYVLIMYNYSVIVNRQTPLHITTECIFDKSSNIMLKIDTEDNLPVLDNMMVRNTPRVFSLLKELMYYAYDLTRMMKYIRLYLFKEVSYTMYYSYFNKRMNLNQVAMSYDMMYNFNDIANHCDGGHDDNNETIRMLVSFYYKHKNTSSNIFPIDGKTFTWGGRSIGCIGTIHFSKGCVKTSTGDVGKYTWLNASSYCIEFDEPVCKDIRSIQSPFSPTSTKQRFIIAFDEDGSNFTGYSESGMPYSIQGVRFPFSKIYT